MAQRVVTAEYLNRVLQPTNPAVDVVAVRCIDESEGSASRLRLEVTYAPGCDAGLPSRIFLKRHLAEFGFPQEMYTTEVNYYRELHGQLDMEKPALYGVQTEGPTDFAILMEDIGQRQGARLGIVTQPASVADVAGVLKTLATLHARFWQHDLGNAMPIWLQPADTAATVKFWQKIGPRLVARHLERGHRVGSIDLHAWPHDRMWAAFAKLAEYNALPPLTALHGDVHSGNVYYLDGAPGGLLDWQLMLRGSWALDVGYLLQTALTPDERAANEVDLLRGYLADLARLGVERPSFEEAFLQYRRQPIWGVMMWLITPAGVHNNEVQLTNLQRCVAAANDLETFEALGC